LAKTHMPILYIIDPDDELVSYSDFQDLLEDYEDNSINFFEIQNNESQLEEKRHHLIITPQSLGQNEWNKMIIKILNFLLPSNDNQ